MTSRRSSGSMRVDSAVEPTKSENITVTWRRSAVSRAFGSAPAAGSVVTGVAPPRLADGREHFPPMPKQDADVLEILIGQMAQYRDINFVLGKALRVLGHAELFEPVRNLLHRGLSLHHAARSTRMSISLRSVAKSIGLVNSASAPFSKALRFVSASPYAVIIMTGTSGRSALAFGRSSRPLIPGMLMSERIKMSDTPAASVMR